jgi:hypothetical protein
MLKNQLYDRYQVAEITAKHDENGLVFLSKLTAMKADGRVWVRGRATSCFCVTTHFVKQQSTVDIQM